MVVDTRGSVEVQAVLPQKVEVPVDIAGLVVVVVGVEGVGETVAVFQGVELVRRGRV